MTQIVISDAGKAIMEKTHPAGSQECADCGKLNIAGEYFFLKPGLTMGRLCTNCRRTDDKKRADEQAELYRRGEEIPEHTDEITCPWCGYEDQNSGECPDDDDQNECGNCGGIFSYEREVTVTYSSSRVTAPEQDQEVCRVCGCSTHNACVGGCYWVEPGLCSNCEGEEVPDQGEVVCEDYIEERGEEDDESI